MAEYRVGQRYHPDVSSWPEGTNYNYRAGYHELLIALHNPSRYEIADVRSAPAEFALVKYKDLLVLLFCFGCVGWGDAPYSWHLVPREQRVLPEPVGLQEPHTVFYVFLLNAGTGIIEAMRMVTVSPAFSVALTVAIQEQAEKPWGGRQEYDRQVDELFMRYHRPDDLLKIAITRSRGGA